MNTMKYDVKSFVSKAIQCNIQSARILCQHYDRTEKELIDALCCRVDISKGKSPTIRINFTDNQTGAVIKLNEPLKSN